MELTDVTVHWTNPLSVPSNTFFEVNVAKVQLHVPEGTKNLYAAAPVWKDFYIIETTSITGSEETLARQLQIYPNPAKTEITIESGDLKIDQVEIFDLSGRRIFYSQFSILNSQLTINISGLPQGVYLLKVYSDKELIIRRFAKE